MQHQQLNYPESIVLDLTKEYAYMRKLEADPVEHARVILSEILITLRTISESETDAALKELVEANKESLVSLYYLDDNPFQAMACHVASHVMSAMFNLGLIDTTAGAVFPYQIASVTSKGLVTLELNEEFLNA